MRILFANDGIGDAGGVQSYLAAVMPALAARGHAVALLHLDALRGGEGTPAPAGAPHFCIEEQGADGAIADALGWRPDVVFSHNMRPLDVESRLIDAAPVVKFMHGYFGTCIGGQKAHLWPRPEPCGRRFGPACLALYVPRRNGRLNLAYIGEQWRWANAQNALFARYAAIVTASEHMRREYVENGVGASKAFAIPLFPTIEGASPVDPPAAFRLLFLGRMTRLKGGDALIRAVSIASKEVGRPVPLTMAGDGPQRAEWEALARSLGVDATFVGWVDSAERPNLFRSASLLAVPSVWPEPFGLVGLEAASFGVPALAFDVGGIRDWLSDGVNGWLVDGDPPKAEALAKGIVRAITNPDQLREMRGAARETAERMTLDAHVDRLERVLADAAGSASSGAAASTDVATSAGGPTPISSDGSSEESA